MQHCTFIELKAAACSLHDDNNLCALYYRVLKATANGTRQSYPSAPISKLMDQLQHIVFSNAR